MLISRFEEIKMLEEETFGEFYTKMSDLRNSMVSLAKIVSDVKLIRKILRSLPKRFRIKVTTIEDWRVGGISSNLWVFHASSQEAKAIALKASKKKVRVSSEEDSDNEEDAVAMLAKNFGRLMKNDKFKKKFTERLKKVPRESKLEEAEKKDPRGPRCFECLGFGHIRADCVNLKQVKGKAYNATLSDESEEEEETPAQDQKFLAFVAPHEDQEDSQSYYSEHSDEDREELKEAYKVHYVACSWAELCRLRRVPCCSRFRI
jgi:hypothetical protein